MLRNVVGRVVGNLYRPPSEAGSFVLQATIGCSWNKCAYCVMYEDKSTFSTRPLKEILDDIDTIASRHAKHVRKVFVADGDALVMPTTHWYPILDRLNAQFPHLTSISAYATARNVLEKTDSELSTLRENGLKLLYVGPESGDDETLKLLRKGGTFDDHVEAAEKAHNAGMELSAIFLLGAGGKKRSFEHAKASALLASKMDPKYVAALTCTVLPESYLAKRLIPQGKFELPSPHEMLQELEIMLDGMDVTDTLFASNHASNYVALNGNLPRDKKDMLQVLQSVLRGESALRPEWLRGL